MKSVEHDHELNQQGLDNLKTLLHQTIDDAEPILLETLGRLVTETKPSLVDITHEYVTEPTSKKLIEQQFEQGQLLQKSTYHRFAWLEKESGGEIFVAGESYHLKQCSRQQLILLTENTTLNRADWLNLLPEPEVVETLCLLIEEGAWQWQTLDNRL